MEAIGLPYSKEFGTSNIIATLNEGVGIGEIHEGNTNNVVCDQVLTHDTIRTHRDDMDELIYRRIEEIAANVTRDMEGIAVVETSKYTPALRNDHYLADAIVQAGIKTLDQMNK